MIDNSEHMSGIFCFALFMKYLKIPIDMQSIQHEFCPDGKDFTPNAMVRAAKSLNLRAKQRRINPDRIDKQYFPLIAISQSGHYFIIAAIKENQILIQKPGKPPESITRDELNKFWNGDLILITSRSTLTDGINKFDLTWFVPVIVKYRKLFRDIFIASFFIQVFALITPLIFQVVMDKVLVHRAEMTLNVLFVALLCITVFEVTLEGLRSYVFSHTSCRIDVELGSQLFRHMMKLPLIFFNHHPVGQVVARVRELENIRNFLTSSALTLILDLFFSVIFIVVMFFYSERLAWIVVASLPFYIAISVIITPGLRKRTEEQFQTGAVNQAFLTESLTGVETLKSMAVEPQMQDRWEKQLAAHGRASYRTNILGIYGSQSVQLVSKIVTALLMWQGALEVIAGRLTVGELIAFNMLSGQVAAPILRLAQLWQDFQQFRISMERLGDVINTPTEYQSNRNQPAIPLLKGTIKFENVVFRYSPLDPEILRGFSLEIPSGQVLGLVGKSGSGKSTLTRLLQKLYVPESGKIYIDGNNISLLNPAWLRQQIGVVLQENFLFSRSVSDNIALANPAMDMADIIEAAELAGAHEFITALPRGYQTELGERGTGLSGGQLQRIAIARALATKPRILIFDEATSALDYESEKIIQENMNNISKNRTVIIIAHRLTTVQQCDRIIVISEGIIVEEGSHEQLLSSEGHYHHLWNSQLFSSREKGTDD